MSGYIEGKTNVKQYSLIPMCYDEIISENNPVRVLDAFVETLDMKNLNFKNAIREKTLAGRPSYNPKDILKLYLYGYFNGIRSSRKLAQECKRNIEVFWLINELKPDFRTISEFRKDNIKNMKLVFKEFSILCDSLNLIGKEIVAIDGSKFRANNGRQKNYTRGKIEKQIKYYEENIDKYIEILNKENLEECDNSIKISKETLEQKILEAKQRISELEEIKTQVETGGEISLTDPDARHMKVSNNGTDISHNVQIAVDSKEDLVTIVDVTSSPADQGQLSNIEIQATEELGTEKLIALADKGYWNGEELKKCEENDITTIVSSPKEQGNTGYKRSNFKYNKEENCYICPIGQKLHKVGQKGIKYVNRNACKECPNRDKCTKNKKGKAITINANDKYLEEAKQRQIENMELYKQRQMIVEHVFGTIKRNLGYTYFLLRGNEKVKGESFMHFLIYNIKRVCKIMNIRKIIETIKAIKEEDILHNLFNYVKYLLFKKYSNFRVVILVNY